MSALYCAEDNRGGVEAGKDQHDRRVSNRLSSGAVISYTFPEQLQETDADSRSVNSRKSEANNGVGVRIVI